MLARGGALRRANGTGTIFRHSGAAGEAGPGYFFIYAWVGVVPGLTSLSPPPAAMSRLTWMSDELRAGSRSSGCRPLKTNRGEVFRTVAKAEGKDAVVGGWERVGQCTPAEARWFSVRLNPLGFTVGLSSIMSLLR